MWVYPLHSLILTGCDLNAYISLRFDEILHHIFLLRFLFGFNKSLPISVFRYLRSNLIIIEIQDASTLILERNMTHI